MEYASFGPLLHRTRLHFLPQLASARRVLVLGDGDGRFSVDLLRAIPQARVVALDASHGMLQQLRARADAAGVANRLTTVHGNALTALPEASFDVICTHFLLDCLEQDDVRKLVREVRQRSPRAAWVVSEFALPNGVARWPAWMIVRFLYAAFGLLTGLRVRRLPDHAKAVQQHGYSLRAAQPRLYGLLRSELWLPADADTLLLHPTRIEDSYA